MEDDTEIVGRYILAFVESTGDVSTVFERKTRETFEEIGLDVGEVEEDSWHDAQKYADAMHEIRDKVGEKTLEKAGAEQAKNVPWPEHVNSAADGLQFLEDADEEAFRSPSGTVESNYRVEEMDSTSSRVSILDHSPYPVENYKGVIKGVVDSLSSSNGNVTEVDTRSDEKAAYEVRW
ncbi:hypothetical protein [Halorussus lipolyticus]|uniref:hypothetical protein n=1 Tax=Halorussus lipolyticus TaxID=3034024 RepID=UPI0023E8A1D5|nr:hypothetical protein [Halorussus sp. DT80]